MLTPIKLSHSCTGPRAQPGEAGSHPRSNAFLPGERLCRFKFQGREAEPPPGNDPVEPRDYMADEYRLEDRCSGNVGDGEYSVGQCYSDHG